MWDAISEILNSQNGSTVLIVLLITILIVFVLIKGGNFSVNTEAIKIGARDSERNIIRQQQDYVWQHLVSMEHELQSVVPDYDKRLGLVIIQACYIEYCVWIAQNHLTMNDAYISLKQNKLVDIVGEYTEKEVFQSEEFKSKIRNDTKEVINQLIQIRELYKDK